MLSAWDNIFTGNKYNLGLWSREFDSRIADSKSTAARYDVVRTLISSATVTVALTVVAIGNGIFLFQNQGNVPKMAALLITLPRQLQIIQSIFGFFNLTLSWTGVREQLGELEKAVRLSEQENASEKYIRFELISITSFNGSISVRNVLETKMRFESMTNGRWTVRGRNGAGKSTLLTCLKEQFGAKAFFLPTKFSDLKFEEDIHVHSDGNRLRAVLAEISRVAEIKILILDEWDANLDSNNLHLIDQLIDSLSQKIVIIESRHREIVQPTATN